MLLACSPSRADGQVLLGHAHKPTRIATNVLDVVTRGPAGSTQLSYFAPGILAHYAIRITFKENKGTGSYVSFCSPFDVFLTRVAFELTMYFQRGQDSYRTVSTRNDRVIQQGIQRHYSPFLHYGRTILKLGVARAPGSSRICTSST